MHEETENGLHQETGTRLLCLRPLDWKAKRRPGTFNGFSTIDGSQEIHGAIPTAGGSDVSEKRIRELTIDEVLPDDPLAGYEEVVQEARRRVWDADAARHYAHRRHVQSGTETDRQLWLARSRESDRALAELEEAERALALAR